MPGSLSCLLRDQIIINITARILSGCGHAVVRNATSSAFASRTTSFFTPAKQHSIGISTWTAGGRTCHEMRPAGARGGGIREDKVKGGDTGGEAVDGGGDSLGWDSIYLGYVAMETGEELVPVWVGSGVLDEFCALGSVLPLIAVVHRCYLTYEGFIGVADPDNVVGVGVGGNPEVAEDDRATTERTIFSQSRLASIQCAIECACR
ncbi:hypothetical protein DFH07DRAFT_775603 [Mycena maculata]|uniref:Uncharacterized protein n=1 Tax=Mycena maculata TaxID=230809 RepID=A0AAD7ITI8_9AGAR|nr:hypothetical protein DFH07DRAFT_775603 [Mycena maculata]